MQKKQLELVSVMRIKKATENHLITFPQLTWYPPLCKRFFGGKLLVGSKLLREGNTWKQSKVIFELERERSLKMRTATRNVLALLHYGKLERKRNKLAMLRTRGIRWG